MANQKHFSAKTIATGAVGVAAAAGVVAGVVALSDKNTRSTVIKGAKDMTNALQKQYKTTVHQISLSKKKKALGGNSKKTNSVKGKTEKKSTDQSQ